MQSFHVVATAPYENFRVKFDTLGEALAYAAKPVGGSVVDVREYQDGRYVATHGYFRYGRKFTDDRAAFAAQPD